MRDHELLTFPLEEYQRRLNELRERMAERRLDTVLIIDPDNLLYLTGHQTTGYSYLQTLIVPLEKEPIMVLRLLEETNLEPRTWLEHSRSFNDTGDAVQTIWHTLEEFDLLKGSVGYEANSYFLSAYKQARLVATLAGRTRMADCSGIVEESRLTKSELELDAMRKAARATVAGMEAGIAACRVGITENEIAAEVHRAMYAAGGEYPAVAPYITSGPRTMIGHATWEGRTTQADECVFLEIGGCFRRYHTAMMRTVFLGEPPAEMRAAEELCQNALVEMKKVMRTGAMVHEADGVVRDIFHHNETGGQLLTRTGYSIGIAFAPSWDEGDILSIKPGEDTVLKPNMTFHLIPWLVGVAGRHVMALSETVIITDEGAKSFFDMPVEMTVKPE